jgi:peroxiredoxin
LKIKVFIYISKELVMNKLLKFLSLQVFVLLIFSSLAFAEGMEIKVGDKAPDFTLREFTSGKKISLSDYKGKKIILIQFWATWCALCKREIPYLIDYYKSNEKHGDFEVLGIVLPGGENDKKKIKELIDKYKIPYPILLDSDSKVATEKYELSGLIPVIAIIDKEGIMQYEHVGEITEPDDVNFVLEDLRGIDE